MLTTNKLILSMIIVIVIMLFMLLFKLPNYRMPAFISVNVLFLLVSMFILKISTNYKFSALHILVVLLPVVLLTILNVNKKFKSVLDNKEIKVDNLNTLQVLTTILLIMQMIILYTSINSLSTDRLYISGFVSMINIFLTGLLWRVVAFYITDG